MNKNYFFNFRTCIIIFILLLNSSFSGASTPQKENSSEEIFLKQDSVKDWSFLWNHTKNNILETQNLQIGLLGFVSVLAAHPFDDQVRVSQFHHQKMSSQTSQIGDFLGTGIPGITFASSQYFLWDSPNGQKHLFSIAVTGIATSLLKVGFGRQRPGGSQDHHSFPSGHTSTMFASATSLSYEYGWGVGLPMYALAAFTASSRLADDAHWFSDVIGGAFIGFMSARAVHSGHQSAGQNLVQKAWILIPSANGLTLVSQF